jgi:hypothetical protein
MTCEQPTDLRELPEPKKPVIVVVPRERFLEALRLLEIPDAERVCVLPFLKVDGRDGLVFREDHTNIPLDATAQIPRVLTVRGNSTVIASTPVEGSEGAMTTWGSYGWVCIEPSP